MCNAIADNGCQAHIMSKNIAYGIASRALEQAGPERLLCVNRKYWTIENSCHYIIDWN